MDGVWFCVARHGGLEGPSLASMARTCRVMERAASPIVRPMLLSALLEEEFARIYRWRSQVYDDNCTSHCNYDGSDDELPGCSDCSLVYEMHEQCQHHTAFFNDAIASGIESERGRQLFNGQRAGAAIALWQRDVVRPFFDSDTAVSQFRELLFTIHDAEDLLIERLGIEHADVIFPTWAELSLISDLDCDISFDKKPSMAWLFRSGAVGVPRDSVLCGQVIHDAYAARHRPEKRQRL